MSASVGAVVLVDSDIQSLDQTIKSLQTQSTSVDQVVIAYAANSPFNSEDLRQWIASKNLIGVQFEGSWNQAVAAATNSFSNWSPSETNFYWLLKSGDEPQIEALARLTDAIERSPSLGILAPKLVDQENPKLIRELGLTLTPAGGLFSAASDSLDQAQFDGEADTLAVSTAGMLVRSDIWAKLSGLDERLEQVAKDYDFSIRARLGGYRVEVVPSSKIAISKPEKITAYSSRKAELQLKFAYSPPWLLPLFWLVLPIWTLVRVAYQIAYKRIDLLWPELSVGLGAFFTPWKYFSLSRKVGLKSISLILPLRASRAEVRAARRQIDFESSAVSNVNSLDVSRSKTATAWWAFALIFINLVFWPKDSAVIGGSLRPLSSSWLDVFARAGSGWQVQGGGIAIPADPIQWLLAALGALTFWQPSLAISIFLLASRSIAFIGARRLLQRMGTSQSWVTVGALIYSLGPSFSSSLADGNFGAVVSLTLAPWLVGTVLSALDPNRVKSSWQTQVGLAGLLLFVVIAASPSTIPLWFVFSIALGLRDLKHIYRLAFISIPSLVIFAPYAWFLVVGSGHPLELLADPFSPKGTSLTLWQALLGSHLAVSGLLSLQSLEIAASSLILVLFAVAILMGWVKQSAGLAAMWLSVVAYGWLISHFKLLASGQFLNPDAIIGLSTLVLAVAVAQISPKRLSATFITASVFCIVLPLSSVALFAKNSTSFNSGRTMPAIVQAQWDQGERFKVLEIDGADTITATLITPQTQTMDGQSLGYRLTAAKREGSKQVSELTEIAANLVAASSADLTSQLGSLDIAYVLAPEPKAKFVASLDSSPALEAVGTTSFGRLWRVPASKISISSADLDQRDYWSISKVLQCTVLFIFALLALPTVNRRRKSRDTSFDESENSDVA